MRQALIVAAREIGERRAVLWAALVAGIVPFASPLFPGVRAGSSTEARDVTAMILALAFGGALALLLGATVIGRDLSERRLGFDFARPLGAGAIWAGRLLGAVVLSIAAVLATLLPTAAIGGGALSRTSAEIAILCEVVAIGVMILVPLAHAGGIAARSHSRWMLLDLAGILCVVPLAASATRRLYDGYAFQLLTISGAVLIGLATLALWTASAIQIAVGRTDPRRAHMALSLTLWGSLVGLALLFQAYTGWVVLTTPADLRSPDVFAAPRGDWACVGGIARGRGDYRSTFLVNTVTGQYLRMGPGPGPDDGSLLFSADGRRAAWLRRDGPGDTAAAVHVIDLDHGSTGARPTSIVLANPWSPTALSADGSRLAVIEEGTISVFDLDSGRTLAAVRFSSPRARQEWGQPAFRDTDHVRIYRWSEKGLEITELDVAAREVRTLNEGIPEAEAGWVLPSVDHGRLLLRQDGGKGKLFLLRGDGTAPATLGTAGADVRRWGRFLADGRIVILEVEDRVGRLILCDRDGAEIRRVDLGATAFAMLGFEIAPDRIVVWLVREPRSPNWRPTTVDLSTGATQELASGGKFHMMMWPYARPDVEPGSAAATLFLRDGRLVRLDPASGALQPVPGM